MELGFLNEMLRFVAETRLRDPLPQVANDGILHPRNDTRTDPLTQWMMRKVCMQLGPNASLAAQGASL